AAGGFDLAADDVAGAQRQRIAAAGELDSRAAGADDRSGVEHAGGLDTDQRDTRCARNRTGIADTAGKVRDIAQLDAGRTGGDGPGVGDAAGKRRPVLHEEAALRRSDGAAAEIGYAAGERENVVYHHAEKAGRRNNPAVMDAAGQG